MTGNNSIILNAATIEEAFQLWVDKHFQTKVKVTSFNHKIEGCVEYTEVNFVPEEEAVKGQQNV